MFLENVFDIKRQKNLNFILPKSYQPNKRNISRHEVVLLIHLYYAEKIPMYIKYFKNIPEIVDVIFTVSNDAVERELYGYLVDFRHEFKIIHKENRGRDISALLVAARKELLRYQYIGFVHDKKAKDELSKVDTEEWNFCLWENMIGSECYVYNVIDALAKNNNLGVLAPPIPITRHLDYGYTNKWSLNLENVRSLTNKLSIKCELDEKKPPIVLGTVFWAKGEAVEKLLCHEWKYTDFDQEPLADDGTISHAIERLLPYVAQDAGFETGWVMTDEYAAKRMEDQYHIIMDAYCLLRGLHRVRFVEQAAKYTEYVSGLKDFCRQFEYIYIYGTGDNGKECFNELLNIRVVPSGFLVSSLACRNFIQFFGVNVQTLDAFVSGGSISRTGIVIAVQKSSQQEVAEYILSTGISNKNIYMRRDIWTWE